ncbi:MAG: LytTR family transcriptional regulator [Bacteroidales bacterium]|nr:LytTR family transcriptional regulator [Bacteroidales bacterium]
MKTFPRALTRLPSTFIHMAALPVSFLVGALVYEPAALNSLMGAGDSYAGMTSVDSFNTIICAAIILLVMAISRMTLWLIRRHFPAGMWQYFFWCIMEIVVCCAFTGMYLVLMDHAYDGGFFYYFGRSVTSIGSILVYPYLVLALLYMALDEPRTGPVEGNVRLKFYDNRHQLKFITEASSVLYIESNENYIVIHYLDNGMEKRFQVRNSMKSIEPLCEQAGFARTHRCFIVNPRHVKLIRKEPGGTNVADLGLAHEDGIPISKKYYDSIAALL